MSKQATLGAFGLKRTFEQASPSKSFSTEQPSNKKIKSSLVASPVSMPIFSVESSSIDNLEDLLEPSWRKVLEDEFSKPYWPMLKKKLKTLTETKVVYPPINVVFQAFWLCPFDNTKVVIIGQDPYHGKGQAEGLSFSVPKGEKIPSSLQNIYKEIQNNYPQCTKPKHGHLFKWAKQGVLLLNSCLTVTEKEPNSHKDIGWNYFTDAVVRALNQDKTQKRVWLLWGSFAHAKAKSVDPNNNCILKTVHPSGLSAHKGFIGCGHFKKCNEYLEANHQEPIDWQIDD